LANETDTSSANDLYVTVLHQAVLEERRPLQVPWRQFHTKADPIGRGITAQFPIQDDPAAAVALTESTDATNTQLTTSNQQATATEQGIMATVTDRLAAVSVVDAYPHFEGVLGRSYEERVLDIFAGLYDNFTGITGTSGADLTLVQFLAAVTALAGRDVPGPYYSVLHTQQVLDLRSGSGNTPGGILPGFAASQTGMEFLASPNFQQTVMNDINRSAYAGSILNVDVWQTTAVVTMANGADRGGGIFNKDAIGYHELWDQKVELQRDASLRATEIVVTGCLGAVEIDDNRGQTIQTDA